MRKVISNTTPILTLLKIGKLEILQKLYGQIIVPNSVYQEIEEGKHKELLIEMTEKGTWLSPKLIKEVLKISEEEY